MGSAGTPGMGSAGTPGSPNSWAPYDSYRDCSPGICSIYCPQWCYMVFPPPPPFVPPNEDADSTPNFSPLIIAVIGILASAFLLTTYYTIISKYCNRARRTRDDHQNPVPEFESSRDQTNPAQAGSTGLDETLIKSIAVCKYKKGDGLVEGTECSVCLSEFQEDESLRLLPKCSHAFHLNCIDTWLKSQSNCPLCRASVVKLPPPPPNSSVQTSSSTLNVISSLQIHPQNDLILVVDNDDDQDQRVHSEEEEEDEDEVAAAQQIRRSISLGSFAFRGHLLVADILHISEDEEDVQMGFPTGVGTSRGEASSWENGRNEVLRRSITTGRFSFRKA